MHNEIAETKRNISFAFDCRPAIHITILFALSQVIRKQTAHVQLMARMMKTLHQRICITICKT